MKLTHLIRCLVVEEEVNFLFLSLWIDLFKIKTQCAVLVLAVQKFRRCGGVGAHPHLFPFSRDGVNVVHAVPVEWCFPGGGPMLQDQAPTRTPFDLAVACNFFGAGYISRPVADPEVEF